MLNNLKYYMFGVRISPEACVVKLFHVKRLSLRLLLSLTLFRVKQFAGER